MLAATGEQICGLRSPTLSARTVASRSQPAFPERCPMIQTEIREMERAIADFKAAIQRGETVGAVDRGLSKRDSD